MAFTPFPSDKNPKISGLTDRPGDSGMNATELKAAFDYIGTELKNYINNTLIPQLNNGAPNLGIEAITGLTATTVQGALEELLGIISALSPDPPAAHSIVSDRLSRKTDSGGAAVGTDNIAAKAVTSAELASDENSGTAAVGEHNIQPLAVQTGHIANGAVTGGAGNKIAQSTISKWNMGTDSVGTDQIENGAVTGAKISGESPIPYSKTSGVQPQHLVPSGGYITVGKDSWDTTTKKQTVSVPGILSTDTVLCEPWVSEDDGGTEATYQNWLTCRDYGVRCVANKNDQLVFVCETKPGRNVWFSFVVLRNGAVLSA